MKSTYLSFAAAIAVVMASGCNSAKRQVAVTDTGVEKTEILSQTKDMMQKVLLGTWTATDVNGLAVQGMDRPYVEFGEDPTNPFGVRCYAYDGCNYLNGNYAVTPGGEMKLCSELVSTMRMCEGAVYEMGFKQALDSVSSYSIEKAGGGYTLRMMNRAGKPMLTLSKFESEMLNGAWDVVSISGKSVDKDLNIRLVFDLAEHSIHGNAGCNTLNGKLTVNPAVSNSVLISDIVTTRMTCPDIATEQSLLSALATVVTVMPGESANSALLRNAEGSEAVLLKRANLR